MKRLLIVAVGLLALPLWAKPKTVVYVQSHEAFEITGSADTLSRGDTPLGAYSAPLAPPIDYFINVTVQVHDPQVPLTDAHWCIKGDAALGDLIYHGTISGNDMELEIPDKNGKNKNKSFKIIDRKWRERKNLP
jgi:hypothetical protein